MDGIQQKDDWPLSFRPLYSYIYILSRIQEDRMKNFTPLLIVIAVFLFCGLADAREWVNFESDDVYQYAYNEDSIASTGKDTIKVWVRWEGKDAETTQKIIDQRDTRKELYKDYQGSKQLLEINCSKGTMDVLTSTDYKTNGDTIWTMTFSSRDPQAIPPESRIGKLAKIVCKKK
jgi:hypothetical protein